MKILILCLLAFSSLLALLFAGSGQNIYVSPTSQAVHTILSEAGGIMEKNGKLSLAGEGVIMPGGTVKGFSLSFCSRAPYTRDCLRELLTDCAQILLNRINANEEVRPFLDKYPFTIQEIDVTIFNRASDGSRLISPEICVAELTGGILTYLTTESENSFGYKSEYEETYEEARSILNPRSK